VPVLRVFRINSSPAERNQLCVLSGEVNRNRAPRNAGRCPGDQKYLARNRSSAEFVPLFMDEVELTYIFLFPSEELHYL
jgi:hypothetical protein